MDMKKEMMRLLGEAKTIALATDYKGRPNVRLVHFVFDPERKVLYFATFPDNDKVQEMEANPHVAFTTVPLSGNAHVKGSGMAVKSEHTIFDVAEEFVKKVPDYEGTIASAGSELVLYEIHFDRALVTLDMAHIEMVQL